MVFGTGILLSYSRWSEPSFYVLDLRDHGLILLVLKGLEELLLGGPSLEDQGFCPSLLELRGAPHHYFGCQNVGSGVLWDKIALTQG